MKPIYDNLIVELEKEEGLIKTNNDQYRICKVVAVADDWVNDYGICVIPLQGICVGARILTTHLKEFRVDGKIIYTTRMRDIECIL